MAEDFSAQPSIALRGAVTAVRQSRKIELDGARSLLREWLRDRIVRARGRVHYPALKAGGWIVIGDAWLPYVRAVSDPKIIDATAAQWDKADIDWLKGTVGFGVSAVCDVTIDVAQLSWWLSETRAVARKGRVGRLPKFDWEPFYVEIIKRANRPDGLPGRRQLFKDMVEWAFAHWKDPPDDRTIEGRINDLVDGLNLDPE
jgi:hypothetical protein